MHTFLENWASSQINAFTVPALFTPSCLEMPGIPGEPGKYHLRVGERGWGCVVWERSTMKFALEQTEDTTDLKP